YGKDLDEGVDIARLMSELCHAQPEVRFRLSSIEPLEISDQLLEAMQSCPNFMPHFHIPLQSGDDSILTRMRRGYDRETFRAVVKKCLSHFPDAAMGIDILTGFPGEGEEEFANSRQLLEELDATYFHVFPYSKRPGTPAASFPDQVPMELSQQRVAELRTLGEQKSHSFYSRFLQSTRSVLVEHKRNREGLLSGFTDNYIPVSFNGDDRLMGSIVQVLLEQVTDDTVLGKLVVE
ncbi:MAG: radical SAM protein, partial [Thermodesulfobacteriota bacterium]